MNTCRWSGKKALIGGVWAVAIIAGSMFCNTMLFNQPANAEDWDSGTYYNTDDAWDWKSSPQVNGGDGNPYNDWRLGKDTSVSGCALWKASLGVQRNEGVSVAIGWASWRNYYHFLCNNSSSGGAAEDKLYTFNASTYYETAGLTPKEGQFKVDTGLWFADRTSALSGRSEKGNTTTDFITFTNDEVNTLNTSGGAYFSNHLVKNYCYSDLSALTKVTTLSNNASYDCVFASGFNTSGDKGGHVIYTCSLGKQLRTGGGNSTVNLWECKNSGRVTANADSLEKYCYKDTYNDATKTYEWCIIPSTLTDTPEDHAMWSFRTQNVIKEYRNGDYDMFAKCSVGTVDLKCELKGEISRAVSKDAWIKPFCNAGNDIPANSQQFNDCQEINADTFTWICSASPDSDETKAGYKLKDYWLCGTSIDNINPPPASGDPTETVEATCKKNGGEMGWLICPAVDMIGGLVDSMMGWIGEQMTYKRLMDSAGGEMIKNVWNAFVSLANIAFAIVFLIVIYSTAVGGGGQSGLLSNYGIKKIMPRLIIVAIAVNLSFYICAAAVDISNIIGNSLRGFIAQFATLGGTAPNFDIWQGLGGMVMSIMSVAAIVGAALMALANIGTVFVAFLMVIAMLIFRDVMSRPSPLCSTFCPTPKNGSRSG